LNFQYNRIRNQRNICIPPHPTLESQSTLHFAGDTIRRKTQIPALIIALALPLFLKSKTIAEEPKPVTPAQPALKLPPGWTMEDMQAIIAAGTPGKMQQYRAKGAGVWHGKNTMWMMPGADPIKA